MDLDAIHNLGMSSIDEGVNGIERVNGFEWASDIQRRVNDMQRPVDDIQRPAGDLQRRSIDIT